MNILNEVDILLCLCLCHDLDLDLGFDLKFFGFVLVFLTLWYVEIWVCVL